MAEFIQYPQLGVKLEEFLPRDVRRMIIGDYELRYELTDEAIYILRLWHGREDR
ncbi:MAG: type II toxin-antitoxin system RelE/ParE family toxin [Nitrosomonas sp.]|uniref:type II toxin-antitoxin system RelE/ParE family toxin n=1 Tax=Nitrosomonas sp. TaxID=42353 RepID=UPI0032ED5094